MKPPEPLPLDELCRRRDALLSDIEGVFDAVTLRGGIGLREGRAIDDNASEAKLSKARLADRAKPSWRDIDIKHASKHYSALSFMDADGFRFVIPALMVMCLRYEIDPVLQPQKSEYRDSLVLDSDYMFHNAQSSTMSTKERACAAQFLLLVWEFEHTAESESEFASARWPPDVHSLLFGSLRWWAEDLVEPEKGEWKRRWAPICDAHGVGGCESREVHMYFPRSRKKNE